MAKTRGTRQSSTKAGLQSLGKKMDNTRHGFDTPPASRKAAGAFGRERDPGARAAGRLKAGTATPKTGKAAALRRVK